MMRVGYNDCRMRTEYWLAGLLLFCGSGCGQPGGESGGGAPSQGRLAQAPASAARSGEETDYTLVGVVKKVEKESSHARIKHEAIDGLMDAMEMRFLVADRAELEGIEPGDKVQGLLRVRRQNGAIVDYKLFGLRVTQPAPPKVLTLKLARGKPQLVERPARLAPGAKLPDFAFTLQDGRVLKLSDLRGFVIVLTFIYTRCPLPDFCPLMDRKFSDLAQRLSAFSGRSRWVRLISLSFDPEHDTPEVLRKHAAARGAVPPLWTYAVVSHEELAKIAPGLGLLYEPGNTEIAHNLCTAIIDRQGRLARLEVGTERNKWEAADLLRTVYSLIPGAAK